MSWGQVPREMSGNLGALRGHRIFSATYYFPWCRHVPGPACAGDGVLRPRLPERSGCTVSGGADFDVLAEKPRPWDGFQLRRGILEAEVRLRSASSIPVRIDSIAVEMNGCSRERA